MDILQRLWHTATTTSPPTQVWLLAVGVLAGLTLALTRYTWPTFRHAVTLAHEAGHAIVGVLTGRRLNGIRLHTDTSGTTTTSGQGWGISGLLTTLAGYPAPAAVAGLLLAALITGHANAATGIILVVLTILLLFTRNTWGLLVTATTITLFTAMLWVNTPTLTHVILASVVGLYAAGAVRTLLEERTHRKNGGDHSDLATLTTHTGIPATVWWLTVWALIAGWLALPSYLALSS